MRAKFVSNFSNVTTYPNHGWPPFSKRLVARELARWGKNLCVRLELTTDRGLVACNIAQVTCMYILQVFVFGTAQSSNW